MNKISILNVALIVTCGFANQAEAQLLAFPGAEGFGAHVSGGRGGDVYIVTNLNNSGPGSLRSAISQPNRTVVFEVGGTIEIDSQLVFSNNITLAGHTAPGGVAVYGHGVSMSNRNNIIVQHMTFRQGVAGGSSTGTKAVNITGGRNIILDHVSMSWGRWGTFGITNDSGTPFEQEFKNITVQNSIISEAVDPQRFGAIVDSSRDVTFARNLWVNNQSRNPKGKADMQYINNVVYNWGSNGYVGGHSSAPWKQDLINNYLIAGPSSSLGSFLTQFNANDLVYHTGNYVDTNRDGQLNGRPVVNSDFSGSAPPTFIGAQQNFPAVPVQVMSAVDAYDWVVANAGNSRYRDSADQRVIDHVKSLGTLGAIINHENEVGGAPTIVGLAPPLDTSRDGIPDYFKMQNGFGIHDPIHNVNSGDGYTWMEKYLHTLLTTEPPNVPPSPTTSFINISTMFGRGADAEVSKNTTNGVTTSGGNGIGPAMNARWIGSSGDRNEYILLRFDLSELEPESIQSAGLQLTAFRNMGNFAHRVYGLNPDVDGQLWDEETIDFISAPGLHFDGISSTRGLIQSDVTLLGEFSTAGFAEGSPINFQHPNLASFLNTMAAEDLGGEGGVATLILERVTENSGQSRFATKEATHLDSTSPGSVAAGTYAPQLMLNVLDPFPVADYNGDGIVDGHDFLTWQREYAAGEMTEDELAIWEMYLGAGNAVATTQAQAVPEPTSLIIVATMMLFLPRLGRSEGQVSLGPCPPAVRFSPNEKEVN